MKRSHRETGQAIILIAFIFIGLLVAVGIVVDLGRYLAAQTQLHRAVDSAALAGAAQFRLNSDATTTIQNVDLAARDTLRANGVTTETLTNGTEVDTCFTDSSLCTTPPTKKVRVAVTQELPLYFLSLIGWRSVGIQAEATTEAAAVDIALLLDTSDSMSSTTCGVIGDYACDIRCNNDNSCLPFEQVKRSAQALLDTLSPNYDRVTVIPFAISAAYTSPYDPNTNPNGLFVELPWELNRIATNIDDARAFIRQLKMTIPPWATSESASCPGYTEAEGYDPRQCTNTNIGAALRVANSELTKEFDPSFPGGGPNNPAKERLRVIVLLTDGAVNASGVPNPGEGAGYGLPSGSQYYWGFCPRDTWYAPPPDGPFCRAAFRPDLIENSHNLTTSLEYDAVDYAIDWGNFAMLNPPVGNGIVVFTIGLGDDVVAARKGDPVIGAKLLRYLAAGGDDGDLATDPCMDTKLRTGTPIPYNESCGNYYYAPTGNELLGIFRTIAGRIFTRINK